MGSGCGVVARIIGDNHNRSVIQAPLDFWWQVNRYANGRPIAPEQIGLIVEAIEAGLAFAPDDALLDLACGNGALSHALFGSVSGYLGVDVSEGLISVARRYFAGGPGFAFQTGDVASYVDEEERPERFTKALCYGSFAYLTRDSAAHVLETLARRFTRLERVFIGNLPDRERVDAFYPGVSTYHPELSNPLSEIGVWRSAEELTRLAESTGWAVSLTSMPPAFYAAHYRYDALLTRPA